MWELKYDIGHDTWERPFEEKENTIPLSGNHLVIVRLK